MIKLTLMPLEEQPDVKADRWTKILLFPNVVSRQRGTILELIKVQTLLSLPLAA